MSSLTGGLPICKKGQTIIINAPTNTYKCGTIYGDPLNNTCSINTNDTTNYLITCDGYTKTIGDTNDDADDTTQTITVPTTTTSFTTTPINNDNTNNTTNNNTTTTTLTAKPTPSPLPPRDYSPFVYPTFAPPPCNVISKLIIKPANQINNTNKKSEMATETATATQQQLCTPTTRMNNYNTSEQVTPNEYIYESIPFPYLPPFKTF